VDCAFAVTGNVTNASSDAAVIFVVARIVILPDRSMLPATCRSPRQRKLNGVLLLQYCWFACDRARKRAWRHDAPVGGLERGDLFR
jgi:hypothetical protein